jgi:hypothetical protein
MTKGHVKSTPKLDPQGRAAGRRMPVAGPVTDDPRPTSPLLPHEHDESAEIAPGPRPDVIRRAHRDVAEGRVDTEARSHAVRNFERAERQSPAAHGVRARRGRKDRRT